MDQYRVIDKKRSHPKTSGITDTEKSPRFRSQWNGKATSLTAGDVFYQIYGEPADQINTQQFNLESTPGFLSPGDFFPVSTAELTTSVNSSSAHQVTHRRQ